MPVSCEVSDCTNKYRKGGEAKFFRFPVEEERRDQWLKASGRASVPVGLHNKRICSDHFSNNQYNNPSLKTSLKFNATPDMCLPLPQENVVQRPLGPAQLMKSVMSGTCAQGPRTKENVSRTVLKDVTNCVNKSSSVPVLSPPNSAMKIEWLSRRADLSEKKLKNCRSKLSKAKQKVTACRELIKSTPMTEKDFLLKAAEYLTPEHVELLSCQVKNARRKEGCRWTDNIKLQALRLYYASPKAYRELQRSQSLPSKSCLARFVSKTLGYVQPGLFQGIFKEALKQKIETLTEDERLCSLCFDEMSIKQRPSYSKKEDRVVGLGRNGQPAKHILVFMARGINKSFKQILGYHFVNATVSAVMLKNYITEAVSQLGKLGLTCSHAKR